MLTSCIIACCSVAIYFVWIKIWISDNFVLSLHSQIRKMGHKDHLTIHRGVEQLAARRAHNPEVGGSSPPPATKEDKSQDLSFSFSCLFL